MGPKAKARSTSSPKPPQASVPSSGWMRVMVDREAVFWGGESCLGAYALFRMRIPCLSLDFSWNVEAIGKFPFNFLLHTSPGFLMASQMWFCLGPSHNRTCCFLTSYMKMLPFQLRCVLYGAGGGQGSCIYLSCARENQVQLSQCWSLTVLQILLR